ncbi:MAG: hypothetical protein PHR61_02585 [Candidatus Absconditabacteria bacterium]|nr:hypothetical protein [Candidatus Absconditabacteria bacterium]
MEKIEYIEANDKINTINKYNSLIEKIKGKLFSGLGYEKEGDLIYNKAYFNKGQKITKEYIDSQIQEANKINKELKETYQQIENEEILNEAQKKLLKDLIERSILSNEYHQNTIYIEAEKAGYPLSNKDRIFFRNEVLRIEKLLYGKSIIELDDRKNQVIKKFHKIYKENQSELTTEEKNIREQKILEKFPISDLNTNGEENTEREKDLYIGEEHIFDLVSLILQIEGFKKGNIIKIEIKDISEAKNPAEEDGIYEIPSNRKSKEIYDYFDSQGIGQKFKIIKKKLGGNSVDISKENDNFKKNEISLSASINGKYNITEKVLPIIYDHEVSTHVNTGMGNFNNIYIKDPERGDLEEGIALFNQKMAQNKDIKELYETSIGDIGMFIGENFDEIETKQILELYFKLNKEKGQDSEGRSKRIKMGVPIGEKGSRRKDLTYGNGKEIIKELETLTKTQEGIEKLNKYAKAIYSTKIGYEGIKDIDNILEGIKELDKLEPNFPIFAGKIIYWKLFKGKLDKEKMLENDLRKLIKTEKDITIEQKRLLIKILQLIKQNSIKDKE